MDTSSKQHNAKRTLSSSWYDLSAWDEENQRLEKLEERWQQLWRYVPDVIFETDPEGTILMMNKTIYKQSVEEAIGTNVYDYIPEHAKGAMQTAMQESRNQGSMRSFEVPAFIEGHATWWNIRTIPLQGKKKFCGFLLIATDVTPLKQREQELQIRNTKLKALNKQLSANEKELRRLREENSRLKEKLKK